jgi:hypothetical protein
VSARLLKRSVVALVILVIAAVLYAPRVSAGRWRASLERTLEQTLGRKVEVREVRYQIFPWPGLSAADVIIHELPEFGLEPLAYVGTLHAGLRIAALWSGRFEAGRVELEEASVNLARVEAAGWNFPRLLDGLARGQAPPKLSLVNGRINFRFGTLKSAFYLNEVELDLQTGPEGLRWNYEASPARTDRAEQGFGRFTGRGRWSRSGTPERIEIDLDLERSAASEVLTLITGRDLGLQGRLTSRTRLTGPLDAIDVQGEIRIEGLDSGGLFGWRGAAWNVPYRGRLNLLTHSLELSTPDDASTRGPVTFRLTAAEFLRAPEWRLDLGLDALPAATLLDVSRRFGLKAPEDLRIQGAVSGRVSALHNAPLEGQVEVRDAEARLGEDAVWKLDAANLRWAGGVVQLDPAVVSLDADRQAEVSGAWNLEAETLAFRVKSAGIKLEEWRAVAGRLPGAVPPPLAAAEGGIFAGNIQYEDVPDGGGRWSGDGSLTAPEFPVEGFASPVVLETARVTLRGETFELRGLDAHAGGVRFTGEFRWNPAAARPVSFRLDLGEAGAAPLEDLLRPVLLRRRSLLERTLRRAPSAPEWLRNRRAEGELRAQSLDLAGLVLESPRAHLYWDGSTLDFPGLDARWRGASIGGHLTIRAAGTAPLYRFRGLIDNAAWKSGRFDAEIDLRSSGLGAALRSNLSIEALFQGRHVDLGDETVRQMSGCAEFSFERSLPSLRLRCLDLQIGQETFTGTGQTGPGPALHLDLESSRRPLRIEIPLSLLAPAR